MEKKYMAKHMPNAIIQTNLNEHPAVKAWRKLRPKWGDPERITVLKELKKSAKSAVYRLEGITTEDTAVIAKRCRKEDWVNRKRHLRENLISITNHISQILRICRGGKNLLAIRRRCR